MTTQNEDTEHKGFTITWSSLFSLKEFDEQKDWLIKNPTRHYSVGFSNYLKLHVNSLPKVS